MHEFSHNATLRVEKAVASKQEPAYRHAASDEWGSCLTECRVRCLHLGRGAWLRLFVGRYQQFIRKICFCFGDTNLHTDADCHEQAFKQRGRSIFWKTNCTEGGRLFGSACKELGNFEGRWKNKGALARLEAEAGRRDRLSEAAIDWRGPVGERCGGDSALRLSRNRRGFRDGGDF